MSQLPLFVYGTLRHGQENHHFLAGNFTRTLPGTLCGFQRLTGADGFFVAVQTAGQSMAGELYFLRPELYDDTLSRCDALEDIRPGELSGACYRRAEVRIETAEGDFPAWAYIDVSTPDQL